MGRTVLAFARGNPALLIRWLLPAPDCFQLTLRVGAAVGALARGLESWRGPSLLISPAVKAQLRSVSKEMSSLAQTSSASSIERGPVFKEWIGLPWWSSGKESAC